MAVARPRFVTPRNPERLTIGPEVAAVARRLGFEPLPWWTAMWDTMYELDEHGHLFYREARITVPRQSGKTTATLVRQVDRMLHSEQRGWGKRPVAACTAQTASDARAKMVHEWQPIVECAGLKEWKRNLKGSGTERIEWMNGGMIRCFPPSQTGAHGQTLDAVDLDEVFAYSDNRVEQGCRPAMITRPSPQLVIQSTAGTSESVYFRGKVDDGRTRVESGDCGHVYYLEYSAGPDDDIHNPEHWPHWMPALGHTQTLDALMLEHETMEPDEWARAFGNLWVGSAVQIIPAVAWSQAATTRATPTGSRWLAVDVSPGLGGQGRTASIAVASWHGDEIHVQVLSHGPGISWVADKLGELTRTHAVQAVYVDTTGPITGIMPDLQAKSAANIEVIDTRTMAASCGRFHQGVLDRQVRHYSQDILDAAVAGAEKRTLEDSWAWKRRTSSADISPLVAVTLAYWAAVTHPSTGLIQMYTR